MSTSDHFRGAGHSLNSKYHQYSERTLPRDAAPAEPHRKQPSARLCILQPNPHDLSVHHNHSLEPSSKGVTSQRR